MNQHVGVIVIVILSQLGNKILIITYIAYLNTKNETAHIHRPVSRIIFIHTSFNLKLGHDFDQEQFQRNMLQASKSLLQYPN